MKGLEPPRLSAPEPKSGASTSSATSAIQARNINTKSSVNSSQIAHYPQTARRIFVSLKLWQKNVYGKNGANDGIRTRDHSDHNRGLYQLSYVRHAGRHKPPCYSRFHRNRQASGYRPDFACAPTGQVQRSMGYFDKTIQRIAVLQCLHTCFCG